MIKSKTRVPQTKIRNILQLTGSTEHDVPSSKTNLAMEHQRVFRETVGNQINDAFSIAILIYQKVVDLSYYIKDDQSTDLLTMMLAQGLTRGMYTQQDENQKNVATKHQSEIPLRRSSERSVIVCHKRWVRLQQ